MTEFLDDIWHVGVITKLLAARVHTISIPFH